MAVYKIFPSKDAAIYSEFPTANTGLDEILEVAGYEDASGTPQTARTLIEFSDTDIDYVVGSLVTGNYSSSLKLFLAEATELPVSYNIQVYPVSASWDNGKGKYGDSPVDISGVSWNKATSGVTWNVTGSDYLNVSSSVQAFGLNLPLDINLDVSEMIRAFRDNSLENYGMVVKLEDAYEYYITSSLRFKFFSRDTNTIYPPVLEIKWDDSSYITGSLSVLNNTLPVISIKNNRNEYADNEKVRFRLTAKPKYPTRQFTTASVYLTNFALPTASYWGIRDEFTEEMVVDFDTQFTKISCDSTGPYFDVYMQGLQPERYYRFVFRVDSDGLEKYYDNEYYFKVIR